MKHKKSVILLLIMSMLLTLGTAGCGSTDDSQKDTDKVGNTENDESQETDIQPGTGTEGTSEPVTGVFENMKTVDFDGNEVDSSIFAKNDLTVINIWATWCGPCVGEVAVLDQLNKEYDGTGVAIKGLIFEDFGHEDGLSEKTREAVNKLLEKTGAEYQQLLLSVDMLQTQEIQSVEALPTTVFVNAEGKIIGTVAGARDYDGWKEIIEEYLAKVADLT